MKHDITHAIQSLCPGAAWSIRGVDYDSLDWRDSQTPKPTIAELEHEVARLDAAWEATQYARARAAAYPPISDQLDAIMKWLATENEFSIPSELKSIAMKCMSVKAQFPKGGKK